LRRKATLACYVTRRGSPVTANHEHVSPHVVAAAATKKFDGFEGSRKKLGNPRGGKTQSKSKAYNIGFDSFDSFSVYVRVFLRGCGGICKTKKSN
jgi:hypothetical protein